jgi:hypothetical protein
MSFTGILKNFQKKLLISKYTNEDKKSTKINSFSFEAKMQFILSDFAIKNTYFVVYCAPFLEIFFLGSSRKPNDFSMSFPYNFKFPDFSMFSRKYKPCFNCTINSENLESK